MRKTTFYLLLLLTTNAFASVPDCDTIFTTDGRIYIANVLKHDARQIQFSLCDDAAETVYAVPNERISSIRKGVQEEIKVSRKHARVAHDSRSLLLDEKGSWLALDVTQLLRKGVALSYEKQLSRHVTYQLETGMRWHDFSPTGFQVYEYTDTYKTQFLSPKKIYSSTAKHDDLGDFLPTVSGSVRAGIRFYANGAEKSNFFIQPSLGVFHHAGYRVEDNLTLLSERTTSDSESWVTFSTTTYQNWKLERRITQKSSRTTLNASLLMGYRLVGGQRFAMDIGAAAGKNFGGTNDSIAYYGLKNWFTRGFITFGWRIQ